MGGVGKKSEFTLKGINPHHIDEIYNLPTNSSLRECQNVSSIADLSSRSARFNMFTFFSEEQKNVICKIAGGNNQVSEGSRCWWCRLNLVAGCLGCPLDYQYDRMCKVYMLDSDKCVYTNSETAKQPFVTEAPPGTRIEKRGYYVTEGQFCSFNCIKAWIDDNQSNAQYVHSEMLLYKMFREVSGEHNTVIRAAPHWRLLRDFGGYLDSNAFQKDFNRVEYIHHGTIVSHHVGQLYEEKFVF